MSNLLIVNGRVIDPASGRDEVADVAIADGIVAAVGKGLSRLHAQQVIDAGGCIVAPGLIDPHVHLREPGMEEAETIESGSRSAAAGGFTSAVCMPNTTPTIDDDAMIEFVYTQAEREAPGRVFPVGAATKGRKGEELAEMGLMARAGAVGFSDDGDCIASAAVMQRALAYIKPTGLVFMQHCQEPTLTRGSSMHAGTVSTRLGLGGWPRVAEEVIIERDVRLNHAIGCRYHVQHMSSGGSVEIVRAARRAGQPVSAEASPHHLLLTHELVDGLPAANANVDATMRAKADSARQSPSLTPTAYWTNAKMNPPLREKSDIAAMLEGIADGTITVLATDHAPHTSERKSLEFESAPFGIVGLETALALYIKALIDPGVIDWPRLIAMMTIEPARLCGLDRLEAGGGGGGGGGARVLGPARRSMGLGLGSLHVGAAGDVTIIDPALQWAIDAEAFRSLSRNTPFHGWRVKGRATYTIVGGEVVWSCASSEAREPRVTPRAAL
jgi:dihydroorotase